MPKIGAPLKVAAKAGGSLLSGKVFNWIFYLSLAGIFVFLILLICGYEDDWIKIGLYTSCFIFAVGCAGMYFAHVGFGPIAYYLLKFVLSTALFSVIYWFFQKQMPLDFWKFLFIFINSWTTGMIGSFTARAATHQWNMDTTVKNLTYNTLVSLFYTCFIIFGVWALFFDTLDVVRFVVVFIMLKLASDGIAYGIAHRMASKFGRGMEKFITG